MEKNRAWNLDRHAGSGAVTFRLEKKPCQGSAGIIESSVHLTIPKWWFCAES
jgi:hypothetical protein